MFSSFCSKTQNVGTRKNGLDAFGWKGQEVSYQPVAKRVITAYQNR